MPWPRASLQHEQLFFPVKPIIPSVFLPTTNVVQSFELSSKTLIHNTFAMMQVTTR